MSPIVMWTNLSVVHMYTTFLVSLPEAVSVTDAVTSSDGRKTTIF